MSLINSFHLRKRFYYVFFFFKILVVFTSFSSFTITLLFCFGKLITASLSLAATADTAIPKKYPNTTVIINININCLII